MIAIVVRIIEAVLIGIIVFRVFKYFYWTRTGEPLSPENAHKYERNVVIAFVVLSLISLFVSQS